MTFSPSLCTSFGSEATTLLRFLVTSLRTTQVFVSSVRRHPFDDKRKSAETYLLEIERQVYIHLLSFESSQGRNGLRQRCLACPTISYVPIYCQGVSSSAYREIEHLVQNSSSAAIQIGSRLETQFSKDPL